MTHGVLLITETDVETLRAYRDLHRATGRPKDISSVFDFMARVAPSRLNDVVEEQDWLAVDAFKVSYERGDNTYFLKPANMRLIRHHNPEMVDRWLANEADRWRALVSFHLDIKQLEEDSEWEGRRRTAFRHDCMLRMLTHADWATESLPVDEVRSMISEDDWAKIRSAFAFSLRHHRIDQNLFHRLQSFSVFFPEEAKRLLEGLHDKVTSYLRYRRQAFLTEVSTKALNWGRVYFWELTHLHGIDPAYARTLVDEEDWELLSRQRHRLTRAVARQLCPNTVYGLTRCLEDLAKLQHLFVS